MSQKMTFLDSRDNKWYWAVYNDAGDFAKLIGPFHSLEEANKDQGVPESTPSGEYIKDEIPVVSVDEAKGVDPVTDANVTPEQVAQAKAEMEQAPNNIPVEAPANPEVPAEIVSKEPVNPANIGVGLGSLPPVTDNGPVAPETIQGEQTAPAEPTLVKAVPTETVEVSEDGKTATFQDGSTAPIVSREEVVAQLGEETVAKIENEVITENKESAPVEVNTTDSTTN